MPILKPLFLFAAVLASASAHAAPPAYDGVTPMVESGPFWFDPAMTAEERAGVMTSIAQAHANITAAYGVRLTSSLVVWCKTNACALYFSGPDGRSYANPGNGKYRDGAKYAFSVPALIITRQAYHKPADVRPAEVLTHEISHLEMRARLGRATVPAWFNEGVASYLGGEQTCQPGIRGIGDLFELDAPAKWHEYTNLRGKQSNTYCQARNEVAEWIASHGGFEAVLKLLARRAGGQSFYALYGRQHESLAPSAPAS